MEAHNNNRTFFLTASFLLNLEASSWCLTGVLVSKWLLLQRLTPKNIPKHTLFLAPGARASTLTLLWIRPYRMQMQSTTHSLLTTSDSNRNTGLCYQNQQKASPMSPLQFQNYPRSSQNTKYKPKHMRTLLLPQTSQLRIFQPFSLIWNTQNKIHPFESKTKSRKSRIPIWKSVKELRNLTTESLEAHDNNSSFFRPRYRKFFD